MEKRASEARFLLPVEYFEKQVLALKP